MPDKEVVIRSLINCISDEYECSDKCQYFKHAACVYSLMHDAAQLLKEQEPRLITADDFQSADEWGWIPAWCEEKGGSSYWEMITIGALEETKYQYWTARPTEEQRKAVKWDD